jgi:hypothetical protein
MPTAMSSRVLNGLVSKLPALRHPLKRGMALERLHVGRQQAEADGAVALAVVCARNPLLPRPRREQPLRGLVRLARSGGTSHGSNRTTCRT